MRSPIESIKSFCLIQLELLKTREQKLRKEIEDEGGLKLVYIDPPFDVGDDFEFDIDFEFDFDSDSDF